MSGDHIILVKRNTLQVAAESTDDKPVPEILQSSTFDSASSAEGSFGRRRRRRRRRKNPHIDIDWTLLSCWEDFLSTVYYVGTSAILGTSLRIFMGRLFGSDCTNAAFDQQVGDFFESFASKICITSDGRLQPGGSIFTDLPANMLGSLLMGLLSPNRSAVVFPWFRPDHPLQNNVPLQLGLKVGLCGCLTTWASWSTQMVVMMDGTDTAFSPQISQALMGYLVGIACSVASFIFGQSLRKCFHRSTMAAADQRRGAASLAGETHGDQTHDSIDIESSTSGLQDAPCCACCTFSRIAPLPLITLLLIGFALGDGVFGIPFYRTMWMTSTMAPFGAVLRWRLSALNPTSLPQWFPWGTIVANVIAAALGAAADALASNASSSTSVRLQWVSPILMAVQIGFAGSLSTVSTMVRELAFMKTPGNAILYFAATVMVSMSVGLVVYCPMIRAVQ